METQNLSTLKIHKLSQEQYLRELEAGNIDEYALYLTPSDDDISNKQDKLIGTQGQVVGFDAEGNAVAQDAVQSDWNQNDETAANYVKNRPFYTGDLIETILLEEQTIEATETFVVLPEFEIIEGQTYFVSFNNTVYECVAHSENGPGMIGNGTLADFSFGNEEPFLMASGIILLAEPSIFTLSVMSYLPEVYLLDEKYISYKPGLNVEGKIFDFDAPKEDGTYEQKTGVAAGIGAEIFNSKYNVAVGKYSHAEGGTAENGKVVIATGNFSHAEGEGTAASGQSSHSEGQLTIASGEASHAEGRLTMASGNFSHAEGSGTNYSISLRTSATGHSSHAEGHLTRATGHSSHAEGRGTGADGSASHAEGYATYAIGDYSHAEGYFVHARSNYQHAQGKYSIVDADDVYAHIVGNGTSTSARSNAHTLDWSGNAWFAGDVYVGSTSGTNRDDGSVKLAKEIAMTGATSSTAGSSGLVPAPAAGDEDKFLKGDGTWGTLAPNKITLVATAGQTFFSIPFEYDSLSSNLTVYFNGILMKETDNYTVDTTNNTVNLVDFSAEAGDIVTIMGILGAQSIDFGQEAIDAINEINAAVADAKQEIDDKVQNAFDQIDVKINEVEAFVDELPDDVSKLMSKNTNNTLDSGYKITLTNVTPSAAGDVTTKQYVDSAIASLVTDIYQTGSTAPSNTKLLWIDTGTTDPGLKYYNGSSWVTVPVRWS